MTPLKRFFGIHQEPSWSDDSYLIPTALHEDTHFLRQNHPLWQTPLKKNTIAIQILY